VRILTVQRILGDQKIDISQGPVSVPLADIDSRFASLEKDVKVVLQGTVPVPAGWLEPETGETVTPSGAPDATGGVDFTRINPLSQPQFAGLVANFKLPELGSLRRLNLNKEEKELHSLFRAEIIPADQRMMDFVLASCVNGSAQAKDRAMLCLMDFFRLQEQNASETPDEFKAFLLVVESGRAIR
jgi:hypothetical protein